MTKRPAFMFYPADWRKDPELRVCSIAARGLWIDMLALMHEGDPYGHLVVNGAPITDDQLARLVGEPVKRIRALLGELESHCVFSRTDNGVVFSRRMVADEHIRDMRAASGKLGGNPKLLHKSGDKAAVNGVVKQTVKQKPTPSVAVAVAVSPSGGSTSVADAPAAPSWVAEGVSWWVANAGNVTHGRFGAAFSALVAVHGWTAVFADAQAWVAARKAEAKPCRVEWCAADASARITTPRQAIFDHATGELTEYGERVTRP